MMMVIAKVAPVNLTGRGRSMTLQFHLRGWKGTAMANHLMNERMTQMRKWIAKEKQENVKEQ